LDQAVSILSSANVVHVQGVRRAFPAATYITYMLSNLGRPTYLLDGVGSMFTAQHSMFQKNDVLFAISFYPYAQETQVAVQSAIENGCKVIVLTDSMISPLCEHADIYFAVKEAELHAFRSLNNSMNLIQAIVLSLINQYPME
jgi:DNA-binding MurR/RpiR family transcriptional regulator